MRDDGYGVGVVDTHEERPARRAPRGRAARGSTSTSNFGVGARENHDASGFYARFRGPEVSSDREVAPPLPVAEPFVCGDARDMSAVADSSVALVVTSPPYFAGKQYEEELERDGVPATYLEYLAMLREVFRECVRTLEPGGRIAVNVANLGRKPYRSLSADVIGILQDDLGLLLRGEVVWQKGEGANGSCAWGSYRSATNPVLRDITERVVIASKGRFDRALGARQRAEAGLPHRSTLMTEDFLSLTLDVWQVPPESARRVGHPAPFPVELPEQLMRLYTFADDLVLDPFMGSGSTLVAAHRLGRRYVGYDLDPDYVGLARERVAEAGAFGAAVAVAELGAVSDPATVVGGPAVGAVAGSGPTAVDALSESVPDGLSARRLAEQVLAGAGFTIAGHDVRVAGAGLTVDLVVADRTGTEWFVEVAGPHTSHRGGLQRSEVVWRTLGRAHVLRGARPDTPLLVLTAAVPRAGSEGDLALRAAGPGALFDLVDMLDPAARARLQEYSAGGAVGAVHGWWTPEDLAPLS